MTTLIRYNKNKNIGILFQNKQKLVKKFYLNKAKNLFLLNNEYNGYCWYINQLKKKNIKYSLPVKKKNFIKLQIIYGKKYNFWEKLIYEKKKINEVIKHYFYIWPSKKIVPYHGDLTFENIQFLSREKIFILDWENFKKKEIWGLDLCYFLISLIVLPSLAFNKPISEDELRIFKKFWKKCFLNKEYEYLNAPIDYLQKKCNSNNNFLFKINSKTKKIIHNVINNIHL